MIQNNIIFKQAVQTSHEEVVFLRWISNTAAVQAPFWKPLVCFILFPLAAIFVHVPMGTPFMCVMHLIVMTENEENEN